MLRPDDRLGRFLEAVGNLPMLELLHCPQHRKVQQGQVDLAHAMARRLRRFSICRGQGPAEPVRRWVGMADENEDAARHGSLRPPAGGVLWLLDAGHLVGVHGPVALDRDVLAGDEALLAKMKADLVVTIALGVVEIRLTAWL